METKKTLRDMCLQGIGAVYVLFFAEPKGNSAELTKLEEMALTSAIKIDRVTGGAFSAIKNNYGL